MILSARRLCTVSYYAVRIGRSPGIYKTWNECKEQVNGFPKASYKKFANEYEADDFINGIKPNPNQQEVITTDGLPSLPVVYTDGCCLGNGIKTSRRVGGIGVYWAPNHPLNVSQYLDVDSPTNMKAELNAAIKALETAIDIGLESIEVRTDSEYTIKSMTKWITRWQKNGWKNGVKNDVANREELQTLAKLCKQINVRWVHVAGHQGVYGNEEADRLAREGASLTD